MKDGYDKRVGNWGPKTVLRHPSRDHHSKLMKAIFLGEQLLLNFDGRFLFSVYMNTLYMFFLFLRDTWHTCT